MDPFGEAQCNIGENQGKRSADADSEMEPEKGDLSPENSKKK